MVIKDASRELIYLLQLSSKQLTQSHEANIKRRNTELDGISVPFTTQEIHNYLPLPPTSDPCCMLGKGTLQDPWQFSMEKNFFLTPIATGITLGMQERATRAKYLFIPCCLLHHDLSVSTESELFSDGYQQYHFQSYQKALLKQNYTMIPQINKVVTVSTKEVSLI